MKKSIRFSLILATLGRKDTVARVLQTLVLQDYPMSAVEVIIVDQNNNSLLDEVVATYREILNLQHIKSPTPGLSLNRNIGLAAATGEVVGFPDDDCEYPNNLLSTADALLRTTGADMVLGSIWDPKLNKPAIRRWPTRSIKLNKFNFYRLTSSITLFTTRREQRFDERFGLGTAYGSNEDVIFVYSLLLAGAVGVYHPEMQVYHDDQPMTGLDQRKVAGYAVGFGKFARLYMSPSILTIFISSLLFQVIGCGRALVSGDRHTFGLRAASLRCRIAGFFS